MKVAPRFFNRAFVGVSARLLFDGNWPSGSLVQREQEVILFFFFFLKKKRKCEFSPPFSPSNFRKKTLLKNDWRTKPRVLRDAGEFLLDAEAPVEREKRQREVL